MLNHIDGTPVVPNRDCESCKAIRNAECNDDGVCMCLPGLRFYSDIHCGNMSDPNGECTYN